MKALLLLLLCTLLCISSLSCGHGPPAPADTGRASLSAVSTVPKGENAVARDDEPTFVILDNRDRPLPDTGQSAINTGQPGEDAAVLINPPSYTKLDSYGRILPDEASQWAMVQDNLTGLTWEMKSDAPGLHFYKQTFTQAQARSDFIAALNQERFGGAADWRLPGVRELATILDKDHYLPAVNPDYFPVTESLDYWSATDDAADADKAWRVHFCRGYVNEFPKNSRFHVRAVRGAPLPGPDLTDNADGTVTDAATGLMWSRAYWPQHSWEAALTLCNALQLAGHANWRLPNAAELHSIVDYTRSRPAIDRDHFDLPADAQARDFRDRQNAPEALQPYAIDLSFGFWSSTNYASNRTAAWVVDFKHGRHWHHGKSNTYFVRAVRGGQLLEAGGTPVIQVPRQGARFSAGSTMEIRWIPLKTSGPVRITLCRRGGLFRAGEATVIATATENDGRFEWKVTGPASVNCMLRIAPLDNESDNESEAVVQGLFSIIVDPAIAHSGSRPE